MTDIVERLHETADQEWIGNETMAVLREAADEIKQLREGHKIRIAQHETEIRRIVINMGKQADEIERLGFVAQTGLPMLAGIIEEKDAEIERLKEQLQHMRIASLAIIRDLS